MFDIATRKKFRFSTGVGFCTVEDLWDLPLQGDRRPNLDDIAKNLNRELKSVTEEVSFVEPLQTSGAEETRLALEIVKHVIGVKVTERNEAVLLAKRKEQKQQILALIDQKENEKLAGLTVDELREMVTAL